jgi:hypothetical protein
LIENRLMTNKEMYSVLKELVKEHD